jgi:hypothetical protein
MIMGPALLSMVVGGGVGFLGCVGAPPWDEGPADMLGCRLRKDVWLKTALQQRFLCLSSLPTPSQRVRDLEACGI